MRSSLLECGSQHRFVDGIVTNNLVDCSKKYPVHFSLSMEVMTSNMAFVGVK